MASCIDKVDRNSIDPSNPKVFPFQADLTGHDPAGGRVCQCSGLIPDRTSSTLFLFSAMTTSFGQTIPTFEVINWRHMTLLPMANLTHRSSDLETCFH